MVKDYTSLHIAKKYLRMIQYFYMQFYGILKTFYIIAKMIVNHVTFIKMQLQLQYRKVLQNKHLL